MSEQVTSPSAKPGWCIRHGLPEPCIRCNASGPRRIQRRRTKGWRMPEGAVYVGRPTKWGSPYPVDCVVGTRVMGVVKQWTVETRREAVLLFRRWLDRDPFVPMSGFNAHRTAPSQLQVRAELAGKDLVCWCPLDQPCHADVLGEIANGESWAGRSREDGAAAGTPNQGGDR